MTPVGVSATQESQASEEGYVYGWQANAADIVPPYPSDVSFRMGVVTFHVTTDGRDLRLGFFQPDSIFGDGNLNNVTPNFGSYAIEAAVPEPGRSVLLGVALACLVLAARRTRGKP